MMCACLIGCAPVVWSNAVCSSTFMSVLATQGSTCAAHCNCWFIT